MNELDLDELDQAVSAMMDDKKAKKPSRPAAPSVTPPAPRSSVSSSPQREEQVQVTVNRPLPQLPQRSRTRGAAMDIVQPQTPAKIAPPSSKPARTAPALEPTEPITPEPSKPAETPAPNKPKAGFSFFGSNANSAEAHAPKPIKSELAEPAKSTWPDPLDFHNFGNDEKPEPSPINSAPEPQESAPTLSSPIEPEASSSPFVTTKVEKRPLGAYAQPKSGPAVHFEANNPEPKPEKLQEHADLDHLLSDGLDDEPKPAEQLAQPKELSPEVLAVESGTPKPEDEPKDMAPSSADLRQMTIPQQYKSDQSQPSQQERPIFDTKEYHAPAEPVHAAHRTGSPWGWVIIVILVILLIAAGALAYLAMTGDLSMNIANLL